MKKAIYAEKAKAIISRLTEIENSFSGVNPSEQIYDTAVDLELLLFKFSMFYPSLYEIRKVKVSVKYRKECDFSLDINNISALRTVATKFIDFLKDE